MLNAKIEFTGERKVFNKHFAPYIATSDIELPELNNGGYNNYSFSEPVTFGLSNLPEVDPVRETTNFFFYEFTALVVTPGKREVSMYYYKTVHKATGKVETLIFDVE